ncbi:glycosyltransferase family 87 protein [Frigidibacter sp. SD6-1]|uniref:glycosyltransferase family 87 protein n=1 Tax=Frigidibacter sp. SD6-1 TaxID=3032581 RepID=UPI0024DF489A|nr:glycosyltransferase family 87 protein [Frigidibacter sp. SD6-1]
MRQGAFNSGGAADRIFALAIVGTWAIFQLFHFWNELPGDLSAVYFAGWFLNNGAPGLIYDAPPHFFGGTPPSWIGLAEQIGGPQATVYPYVYPPLWAALVAPLTGWVDAFQFSRAIYVLHLVLVVASTILVARQARQRAIPYWCSALVAVAVLQFSAPAQNALEQNQPTILTMFLLLLCLDRLQSGRDAMAGLCLAVAVGLKISPVLFLLILLVERRARALAFFAVAGGLLAGLGLLLCGIEAHRHFFAALGLVGDTGLMSVANLSLRTALYGMAGVAGAAPTFDPQQSIFLIPDMPGWIGRSMAISALLIAAGWLMRLRRLERSARLELSWLTIALIIPLFGPLGWQHYYLLPLFLLPGLIFRLADGLRLIAVAAALVSSALATLLLTGLMPWPTLAYVWVATAGWLVILGLIPFARDARTGNQNGLTTLPE